MRIPTLQALCDSRVVPQLPFDGCNSFLLHFEAVLPLLYRFFLSITPEPFSKRYKLTQLVDVRKTVSYCMGRNQPSGRCNALFIIFWRSSKGQALLASRYVRYAFSLMGWLQFLYLEAWGITQGACIRNLKSRDGFIALQITVAGIRYSYLWVFGDTLSLPCQERISTSGFVKR